MASSEDYSCSGIEKRVSGFCKSPWSEIQQAPCAQFLNCKLIKSTTVSPLPVSTTTLDPPSPENSSQTGLIILFSLVGLAILVAVILLLKNYRRLRLRYHQRDGSGFENRLSVLLG